MRNKLKFLVLHCTATPEGREISADTIRHWHTDPVSRGGRGWKQVGYSKMVHLDGRFETLVPYTDDDYVDSWEVTNGVAGINSQSMHIVYVGGTDKEGKAKDTRTKQQLESLSEFVKAFAEVHPHVLIAGHNQFAQKACPSFDVPAWLEEIGVPESSIYRV